MIDSDRASFVSALTAAAEVTGGRLPSETGLELYWRLLDRYDLDAVVAAIEAHLRDPARGAFFPKPADIIRHLEGDEDERAEVAWSDVLLRLRQYGSRRARSSDAAAERAVRAIGGWQAIGMTKETELPFLGKRFKLTYRVFDRRARQGTIASPNSKRLLRLDEDDSGE